MNRIGRELEEEDLDRFSGDSETLGSLIGLADEIRRVLVPVEPRLDFREDLRARLSAVMHQRQEWSIAWPSDKRRRALILWATLGSLIPLLGIVAYLLRSRLIRRPQQAASGYPPEPL